MDPARRAWLAKYAREPRPWSGSVHAAPLLAGLGGCVLELGAGGGKVGPLLPRDAIAIDWAALPPGRSGAIADVRALPVREASVDAIVAVHVLGHLLAADRGRALHEWRRVLRPAGALAIEVFARGDARDGTGREVEPGTFEREGIATHYFERDELRALLGSARFEAALVEEERVVRWGVRRVIRGVARAKA